MLYLLNLLYILYKWTVCPRLRPYLKSSESLRAFTAVFLLEVRKREKIPVKPYEEVRDQISSKVFEGRIEREKDAWYQQARREAAVVIKLKEPQAK